MSKNVVITRTANTPSIPLNQGETPEKVTLDSCAGESADFEDNGLHQGEIFLAPTADTVEIDRKKFGKAWVYYILGKLVDGFGNVIDEEYWLNVNTFRRQDNNGKKVFKAFANLKDAKQRIKAICDAGGVKADTKESTYDRPVFDGGRRVRVSAIDDTSKQAYAYTEAPFIDVFFLTDEDWSKEPLASFVAPAAPAPAPAAPVAEVAVDDAPEA
jgi:hypothetical protein